MPSSRGGNSHSRERTAETTILGILRRGPRRGLTATAIADRGNLNLNTTRTTLSFLQGEGVVSVVGTEKGNFGRPANRYALAA